MANNVHRIGGKFTTAGAADYLGLAVATIHAYVHRGLLVSESRLGASRLFSKAELDRYKRERRPVGAPRQS